MKKQIIKTAGVLLILHMLTSVTSKAQDKLMDILNNELQREMKSLGKQENPPYFISYRVDEEYTVKIKSSFGVLTQSTEDKTRKVTVSVRVGDYKLDNTHELRDTWDDWDDEPDSKMLPIEDNAESISQILWQVTNDMYKNESDKYAKVKANIAVKVAKEDKSPDFSKEQSYQYYEAPYSNDEIKIDRKKWEEKIKKYSLAFLEDKSIYEGSSSFDYKVIRKYFVSSEGAKIAQNMSYSRVFVDGEIKADDGMELPLYKDWFAYRPSNLPGDEVIIEGSKEMVKKLTELKKAPLAESFTGPAILSSSASGVFFHEIFGHRVEGQRMKSETDAQTFKKQVGKKVLPENMNVVFDPTRLSLEGKDLNGYYKYDDEGIKSSKVTVVENGILKGFLMSRCPIENFSNSNGHGRAYPGRQPVTRQSNLIVETKAPLTDKALKKMLLDEAKKQGKEYGYMFQTVVGGFTFTGRFIPNAFNVMPVEVYRVYVDGRPDELVRGVDMVGTPLTMFSQVEAAGDKSDIFTGMCGAESGWVPVTAASPSLFVKQIETQRKYKSQEKQIILPRPDASEDNLIK